MDWRSLPMDDLERHFNPRVAVADAESHLAGRAKASAGVRRRFNGRYDIAYGAEFTVGNRCGTDSSAPTITTGRNIAKYVEFLFNIHD